MSTSSPSIMVQPPTPIQTTPSMASKARVMVESASTASSPGLSTQATTKDFVQRGRHLVQGLKLTSINNPTSLNQDDILLVEQFVNSLRLDLRQNRLAMRTKDNKIECLSKQLKREQDRNRELCQTQSTKRENAAASVDAWRNWADDMKAMEKAWQKWAEDMKEAELVRDEEAKALEEKVKTLEARVVAAEIERDQVSVVLDFTKRELASKKAAIDTAKTCENQEGSASHQHECSLCMDAEADALFLCGHVACCMSCAEMLPATIEGDELVASCPICREEGPFRRIYFA